MNENPNINRIEGREKVLAHFGRWPSFHDSEVVSVTLNRGSEDELPAVLTMFIHAFNLTSKVNEKGHYVTERHGVVCFKFTAIHELQLSDFNNQNSLMGLCITDITERQLEGINFEISFDGSNGLSGSFSCRHIEVVSIESGLPPGSVYA